MIKTFSARRFAAYAITSTKLVLMEDANALKKMWENISTSMSKFVHGNPDQSNSLLNRCHVSELCINGSVTQQMHLIRTSAALMFSCVCIHVLQCDTYTRRLVLGEHAPGVIVEIVFVGRMLRLSKAVDKL